MEIVEFQGIEIDRCLRCHGLWFDGLEKEDLTRLDGAGSIDIGQEGDGSEYNEMVFVECPKCFSILDQVEQEEPYLKYEYCRSCHGTFFDAGEFKAYIASAQAGEDS